MQSCGAKKFSFAASSDRIYYPDVTEEQRKYLKEAWRAYTYLGVRDISTENLIRGVDPDLQTHHNCDPSLLLDMELLPVDTDVLEGKMRKAGIDPSRPIIGIMGNEHTGALVKTLFGEEYQIVALYAPNPYADAFLYNLMPFEWAKAFSYFSLTFSNFFHGTLLSLKNSTPVIAIDYWYSRDEKHITKIYDVLKRLNLTDCYFKGSKDFTDTREAIRRKAAELLLNPPKEKIQNALKMEAESYNSFKEALEQS